MATPPRSRPFRPAALRLLPGVAGLLAGALAGLLIPPASAGEITAAGGGLSLGTLVNGRQAGSCTGGDCAIGGGTRAGSNLFHRFSAFDTRGGIRGVQFDTQGQRTLVVGVTNPLGSFLDKPIGLSSPAALIWLSPGGISLGGGVSFSNVPDLRLSTATGLRFVGGGQFDVFGTTAAGAAGLTGDPLAGTSGLLSDPAARLEAGLSANGDVTLSGGLLTVDRSLLLDAQGGHLLLQAGSQVAAPGGTVGLSGNSVTVAAGAQLSTTAPEPLASAPPQSSAGLDGGVIQLRATADATVAGRLSALGRGDLASGSQASGASGKGGRIEITGQRVVLKGAALDASGPAGGGTVLLGGDVHGANPAVANASTISVDRASTVRADALAKGDGGTVVAYASQRTEVAGLLSVRGGPTGGNGGFVETSGNTVALSRGPDLAAPLGKGGSWLIDPVDITITSTIPDATSLAASFTGSNGVNPSGLIAAGNGLYYGTTVSGGANGQGAIYAFDAGTGSISLAASFTGSNGANPNGLIAAGNGLYYGATSGGGANGQGAIYKFDSSTGSISLAASFTGSNGANPTAPMIAAANGLYYGTTYAGGASGLGAIYAFDSSTGSLSLAASFTGSNGANPNAALIAAGNGINYGTSVFGGASDQGAIYAFDSASGSLSLAASFTGSNGAYPIAPMISAGNGLYYGTTSDGGASGLGAIYAFDSGTGSISLAASFTGTDGADPYAALIAAGNGRYYGTTVGGGANGQGAIYAFDSGTGSISLAASFTGSNGANPNAGLIAAGNGLYYGTTNAGGASGLGAIYAFDANFNPNAYVATTTIQSALNAGGNVTIATSDPLGSSEAGNITLNSPIIKTAGADASLTLKAHHSVVIKDNITSEIGRLDLALDPNFDRDGSGGSSIFSPASGSSTYPTIDLNGGRLTLNGATDLGAARVRNSTITALKGAETQPQIASAGATLEAVTIAASDLLITGSLYLEKGLNFLPGTSVTATGTWTLRGFGEQSFDLGGLATSNSVWWDVIGRDLQLSNAQFTAVGSGQLSDTNVAIVQPGSPLTLSFDWAFGGASSDYTYCPGCIIQNYIAWLQPSQTVDSSSPFFNDALGASQVTGSASWTTYAPTSPGVYYIGSGFTLDYNTASNVPGRAGGLTDLGPYGTVAPFKVIVDSASATLNLQGATIRSESSTSAQSLRVGPGVVLAGSGFIDVPSLTNQGTISPGASGSAGTLTVFGNLNLASTSQLQIDLLGSGSTPAGNDKLVVNGTASLAGGLTAALVPGYTPLSGSTADILTATQVYGNFTTSDLPADFSGSTVVPPEVVSPTYRLQKASSPPPCPGFCWDAGGGTDTLWSTAANWAYDSIPGGLGGSGDVVYFDLPGFYTITLDDSRTIEALYSSSGNNLTILNGGELTLVGSSRASALYGDVSLLEGSRLSVQGGANLAGGLSVAQGATLASSGSGLTYNASSTQPFNLAGLLQINGGSTTFNFYATTSPVTLGSIQLTQGTLTLNGSQSITIGDYSQSGGTLSGSGPVLISSSFSRTAGVITPLAFSQFSINQVSGDLEPGELSVAGPVSFAAQDGVLRFTAPITAATITGRGLGGVQFSGDTSLTATATSGPTIQLAAGFDATFQPAPNPSGFLNSASAGAATLNVQPGASWDLYAVDPASSPPTDLNGLPYAFKQYGKSPEDSVPIAGTGHGLFYAASPNLSVALVGAITKGYDGTTTALLSPGSYSPSGVVSGDTVLFNNPTSGVYDTKNFGTGKLVSVGGLAVTSAFETVTGKPVYGYALPTGTSASGSIGAISQAPLTISAVTDSRVYDGTIISTAAPVVTSGQVFSGDILSGLSQAFTSKNVLGANQSTLNVSGYTLSDGNSGGNYAVTLVNAPGTISKAPAVVTANSGSTVYNGALQSISGFSATGLLEGDTAATALRGVSAGASGRNAGSYASTASGTAQNYELSFVDGLFTISRAPLTISAVSSEKVYDGGTDSSGVPVISAGQLYGGDGLMNLSQSYTSRDALGTGGSTLVVNPGYVLSDGNSGNNYAVSLATASGTISPAKTSETTTNQSNLNQPILNPATGTVSVNQPDSATGAVRNSRNGGVQSDGRTTETLDASTGMEAAGQDADKSSLKTSTTSSAASSFSNTVTQLPSDSSRSAASSREQASAGVARRLNLEQDAAQQQSLSPEQVQALLAQAMQAMQAGGGR